MGLGRNLNQVYIANPSTTLANNDLIYSLKSPYGSANNSGIKYSDLFTQLAGSFLQTTGGVTSGHIPVYGANGQTLKASQVNIDTSQNIYPNNSAAALASTVTSGGANILTVADNYNQVFTGSSTHTVVLPVTSTLSLGFSFYIVNQSTQNVTVLASGAGTPVQVMAPSSTIYVTCTATSGTSAASWNADYHPNLTLPISIANGGTGVSSVTTAPAATAWAGWDANKNLSANNLLEGFTTTATAAGTTTLTVASTYTQVFTGSTTQTVQLPVTSTLVLGQAFYIVNNSTAVVTITSSGGNTVLTLPANSTGYVTCVLTSGTTAASWYADATGVGTDLFPNGNVLVTTSTQTIVNGTFYTADAAGVVTFTLPAVAVGQYFGIAGINGWVLNVPSPITATIGNVNLVGGASATWSSTGGSETVIFQWIGGNILQAVSWTGLPVTSGAGSTPLPISAGTNIAITRSGSNMSIATTGVPALATNNAFTAQNGITPAAITSSSNLTAWNLNTAPNATYAAVENSTLSAPTNAISGNVYSLLFKQNASAAKTFAFNTAYKFPSGVVPVVSAGLSASDIFTFRYDGTNMLCIGISQNIS